MWIPYPDHECVNQYHLIDNNVVADYWVWYTLQNGSVGQEHLLLSLWPEPMSRTRMDMAGVTSEWNGKHGRNGRIVLPLPVWHTHNQTSLSQYQRFCSTRYRHQGEKKIKTEYILHCMKWIEHSLTGAQKIVCVQDAGRTNCVLFARVSSYRLFYFYNHF